MPECLTAEAVLSMPAGPDLDALIVERVFGGKVVYGALTGRVIMARLGPAQEDYGDLPPFSTDIRAAWLLVERLSAEGKGQVAFARRDEGNGWRAGFGKHEATGETLPLALCRAALLWAQATRPAGPGTG